MFNGICNDGFWHKRGAEPLKHHCSMVGDGEWAQSCEILLHFGKLTKVCVSSERQGRVSKTSFERLQQNWARKFIFLVRSFCDQESVWWY